MRDIYLDNAATTRVRPEVAALVSETMLSNYGNPSSPHAKGLAAEAAVRRAREQIAAALQVDRDEIVFTSGGTESNNLAIKGTARVVRRRGGNMICSTIEHPSVLEAMQSLRDDGFDIRLARVTSTGEVDIPALLGQIDETTRLVSVACVNSELGTVQRITDIANAVRAVKRDVVLHVDAVQALGKLPLSPRLWGVDAMSISAHKVNGPKGMGALYVRRGLRLAALLGGGEQESGLRSGTENVPGIVGMGEAVRLAVAELGVVAPRLHELRRLFFDEVARRITEVRVVGPALESAAPHIINLALPGTKGEVMVRLLSDAGVYVSTGSACSTKKRARSHVLGAIGLAGDALDHSLRISFGRDNTAEDAVRAAESIAKAYGELRPWHS